MPLDLAELFADADEPANLAPGHIPAPGSFQPFDEFLIALIEIKPVEPAFLDQNRDADKSGLCIWCGERPCLAGRAGFHPAG